MKPTGKVPIVLIFFKRLCVLEVLDRIREYAPGEIFLVADGGRTAEEHTKCLEIREKVRVSINWTCHVHTRFSEINLGCRGNIPRGISWAFSMVDRLIVLEDDTVPILDFFLFCEEMLERYKTEASIMTISGSNHLPNHHVFKNSSWIFSGYPITWGYATWARAWRHYDPDMNAWPSAKRDEKLRRTFLSKVEVAWWTSVFEQVWDKTCSCDPYDFQWTFASFVNKGLCVVPRVNLITNVGCGPDATHTKVDSAKCLNRPSQPLDWPLVDTQKIERSSLYDSELGNMIWYMQPTNFLQRVRVGIVKHLPARLRTHLRHIRTKLRYLSVHAGRQS